MFSLLVMLSLLEEDYLCIVHLCTVIVCYLLTVNGRKICGLCYSLLFLLIFHNCLNMLQVFLATDDAVPVICFLILEQKKLLSVGLQTVEINDEILFDVKPDTSWSVSAVAAAPVVVTRSQ